MNKHLYETILCPSCAPPLPQTTDFASTDAVAIIGRDASQVVEYIKNSELKKIANADDFLGIGTRDNPERNEGTTIQCQVFFDKNKWRAELGNMGKLFRKRFENNQKDAEPIQRQ